MEGYKVVNIKDPSNHTDKQCVTVNFADNYFLFKKQPPTESAEEFLNILDLSINMNNHFLFGLPNPT